MSSKKHPVPCVVYVTLMLALASSATNALAQVSDQAGFFSADAVVKAEKVIGDIQRQTGRKVVVETFLTLPPGAQPSASFYESWIQERGKATKSDIHILVVKSPAHLEVGASSDTRRRDFTPADHHAVSTAMLEAFRAKNYDRALLDGLNDIATRVQRNQSSAGSGAGVGTGVVPATPKSTGGGVAGTGNPDTQRRAPTGGLCGTGNIVGWVCLAVGALILFSIVRAFARRRATYPGGMGGPGYGQPGYGQPGYGQPGGGGGGFGSGMLGGLLGGVLGGAAYDHFRHGGDQAGATPTDPNPGAGGMMPPDDVSSGGDFGSDPSSGFSSGGDFGGGDSGGGGDSSSGGDF